MSVSNLKLTRIERQTSIALAGLFACRMLGLFLLLPVFAVAAHALPGGENPAKVGLAMGIYGLTQALLQIPFGFASDAYGRRPVVLLGLALFVGGSVMCALSPNLFWITLGRAIQGAGAISSAITAWVADATREEVRTRAMAMIGASIGLSFALSLVLAPLLVGAWGLSGLFWIIAGLGVASLIVARWGIPKVPQKTPSSQPGTAANHADFHFTPGEDIQQEALHVLPNASPHKKTLHILPDASPHKKTLHVLPGASPHKKTLHVLPDASTHKKTLHSLLCPGARQILQHTDLWRLNFGVFCLHSIQVSLFVVIPTLLTHLAHLDVQDLWYLYLPVIVISFVFMVPVIFMAEKYHAHYQVLRIAVAALTLVLGGMAWGQDSFNFMLLLLVGFFIAFNVLEALQPAFVSRIAPRAYKGLALGFYNTAQAAGLFCGGAISGVLLTRGGPSLVFLSVAGFALIWLVTCWGLKPVRSPAHTAGQTHPT